MSYTVAPGGDVVSIFEHVPDTSIEPTWQVIDSDTNVVIAESSDDLTEVLAGSGVWAVRFSAPLPLGDYIILWSVLVESTEYTDTDSFTVAIPVTNDLGLSGGARMPLWLNFCGLEVGNVARVYSYIQNGLRPDGVDVATPGSGLPSILYRTSGTPEVFDSPTADPAPWYDPRVPESGDFLGVAFDPRQCSEIEADPNRVVVSKTSGLGGGTIGPRSFAPLTLNLKGYIIATSDCGAEYGERWLTGVLNPDDECALCVAQIRTCSPPDDGSDDSRGLWYLYNAAVTEGPHFGRDVAPDCHHIISVDFTITCEKPYLYKPPAQCVPATIINPDTFGSTCISFEDWWCGDPSDPICCVIDPPAIGQDCSILTIDATTAGVAKLLVQMFDGALPDPENLVAEYRITEVPEGTMLVVNSARELIHHYEADGTISDGSPFISPNEGESMPWMRVGRLDSQRTVCISVESPAGGGDGATVQFDTQLKVA